MRLSYNIGVLVSILSCSSSALAFQNAEAFGRPASFQKPSALFMNANVVLRPSEDTAAFDSLKIGGCRVHRYTRNDGNFDSETDYVMWYHGRSEEQDQNKDLPPLSTGRIGRATSKNGLSWEKDTEGSVSEDTSGVSVGLNHESWWCFDTAHVGLGSVMLPMSTPAIMTEGGVYMMYYMGGSFEETPIGDYIDREMPEDAKIKGMKMRIGVCVSQDGNTWGRVEGDDPSGACMVPYDKNDPNCDYMASMTDENGSRVSLKEELYCGWPEVVVNIDDDASKSGFIMYYSTMTKEDKQKSIACAVSPDGFRWFKRGLCLEPEEGTLDAGGIARCNVARNSVFNEETGTWDFLNGYTMYYEGVSPEDNKHRIMMAKSEDGRKWTKTGVAMDVGSGDAWDCEGVGSPHVLW